MSDYIKREDAIEEICKGCNEQYSEEPCEPSDCSIIQRLANILSADVVEVVRCKDCRFFDSAGCAMEDVVVYPNDYCSYAERTDA